MTMRKKNNNKKKSLGVCCESLMNIFGAHNAEIEQSVRQPRTFKSDVNPHDFQFLR